MYQQESKELEENEQDQETINSNSDKSTKPNNDDSNFTPVRTTSQTSMTAAQSATTAPDADAAVATGHRLRSSSDINAYENDPSSFSHSNAAAAVVSSYGGSTAFSAIATCQQGVGGFDDADMDGDNNVIRFGTTNPTGDVSLTLGLRHAGNIPDKNASFCARDFGGF